MCFVPPMTAAGDHSFSQEIHSEFPCWKHRPRPGHSEPSWPANPWLLAGARTQFVQTSNRTPKLADQHTSMQMLRTATTENNAAVGPAETVSQGPGELHNA